jgi:hypothetical protein
MQFLLLILVVCCMLLHLVSSSGSSWGGQSLYQVDHIMDFVQKHYANGSAQIPYRVSESARISDKQCCEYVTEARSLRFILAKTLVDQSFNKILNYWRKGAHLPDGFNEFAKTKLIGLIEAYGYDIDFSNQELMGDTLHMIEQMFSEEVAIREGGKSPPSYSGQMNNAFLIFANNWWKSVLSDVPLPYGVGVAANEAYSTHIRYLRGLENQGKKFIENNFHHLIKKQFGGRSDIASDGFYSWVLTPLCEVRNRCGSIYDFKDLRISSSVINVLWMIYSNSSNTTTQLGERVDALNKQNPGRY